MNLIKPKLVDNSLIKYPKKKPTIIQKKIVKQDNSKFYLNLFMVLILCIGGYTLYYRMQNKEKHTWFDMWYDWVTEVKQERLEESRRQALVARFASRLRRRVEHAVFDAWYEKVQNATRARKYFKKMIARYERKSEAMCFLQWRRYIVDVIAEGKEKMRQETHAQN